MSFQHLNLRLPTQGSGSTPDAPSDVAGATGSTQASTTGSTTDPSGTSGPSTVGPPSGPSAHSPAAAVSTNTASTNAMSNATPSTNTTSTSTASGAGTTVSTPATFTMVSDPVTILSARVQAQVLAQEESKKSIRLPSIIKGYVSSPLTISEYRTSLPICLGVVALFGHQSSSPVCPRWTIGPDGLALSVVVLHL